MQMEYYKKDAKGKVFMDRVQSRLIGEQQAKTTKGTNSVNQLETYIKKVLYNEFEVNQEDMNFWQAIAKCTAYAAYENLK